MGDKTGISWTDATWNPVRGCSRTIATGAKQSGCGDGTGGGCYAERTAGRFCGPGKPYEGLVRITAKGARWTGEVRLVPEHLADPLRWRKPRRIFVNSMSDLFHEQLPFDQIAAVFGVMAAAPQHTFQVLTKRASRMRRWFELIEREASDSHVPPAEICGIRAVNHCVDLDSAGLPQVWPLPNVWLGVSVENQEAADERIPELLATPASVRFLSCEPLIGEVDLDKPRCGSCGEETPIVDVEGGHGTTIPWCSEHEEEGSYGHWLHLDGGIDWVIAGCESGPGARTCEVEWLRSLRDQCEEAGVAFFLKQAVEARAPRATNSPYAADAVSCFPPGPFSAPGAARMKAGGVIELPYLDGVQHAAFPEVER